MRICLLLLTHTPTTNLVCTTDIFVGEKAVAFLSESRLEMYGLRLFVFVFVYLLHNLSKSKLE